MTADDSAPARRYSACVVGCGVIGAQAEADPIRPKPASHAGAWAGHPQVDLLAVADLDVRRGREASAALGLPYHYDSAELMLDLIRPHIVSVATPPDSHAAMVSEVCRRRPLAVVCEKPLARSSGEARSIVEACRAAGVRLFVNHLRRFDPALRREAARLGGIVGVPRTAVGWYTGRLREGGTHMVDLMRMFLGEAEILGASGGDALLAFASGARGALLGHELGEHALFELAVTGSEGRLTLSRAGLDITWERAADGYPLAAGYRHLAPNGAWADQAPRSFFRAMAEHVVAVLEGREEPVSTGEDGVAALEIIEEIEAKG